MFKLSFKQQVFTGFALALFFVLVSAISSYFSLKSQNVDVNWVDHTHEVINTVEKTEIHLVNSETGLRGYVLTGKNEYLTPFQNNIHKILPAISQLRQLVSNNPEVVLLADSLELYANQKIMDMQAILEARSKSGESTAREKILSDYGRIAKENFLRVKERIIYAEQKLLAERKQNAKVSNNRTTQILLFSSLIIFGLIVFLFSYIKKTFDQQRATNKTLTRLSTENHHKNWLLMGVDKVNEAMRGEQNIKDLSTHVISALCTYTEAHIGAVFLTNDSKQELSLTGSYAYDAESIKTFKVGESLVGQVALEKKGLLITEVPENYLKVTSGLGTVLPGCLYLEPVIFEGHTIAVIELGYINKPDVNKLDLLGNVAENIGIALNSALERIKLKHLFEQTQLLAEELKSQQEELKTTNEELRTTNEELTAKTEQLQVSEEELRIQQEELRETNEELERKAALLEEQNIAINQAREAISIKAEELSLSSKYKSEFLANMSHELRTPLNSILILARILKENKNDNLSDEQIKYANVILNAGSDLLNLINDILDLSKIESGKIDLHVQEVRLVSIQQNLDALFNEVANNKSIRYQVDLAENLPGSITTDQGRLEQIIKNLLSNAFKFTPEGGSVSVEIQKAAHNLSFLNDNLNSKAEQVISISVTDTGIGIPAEKQRLIFEAFQQADGSTSRNYGGTGLGLSISRELANILGGEIHIKSQPGAGSTFTLYIPYNLNQTISDSDLNNQEEYSLLNGSDNPVTFIKANKNKVNTLLIVEDDANFADILKDFAIEKGFNPIMADRGDTGLEMARTQLPDAIILDIKLPVMDGWTVLKKLKADPQTSHIPVHLMSAWDEKDIKAKQKGAIGFLKKPTDKDQLSQLFGRFINEHNYSFNKVLVIEDQELQSNILTEQLEAIGAAVMQAFTGGEALASLKNNHFDCIILDLNLPDISGFEVLDHIKQDPLKKNTPVIINTAMELDKDRMAHVMQYSEAMVIKTEKSNSRLLDEVSLFVNKLQKESKKESIRISPLVEDKAMTTDQTLKDKTILVTDDDMRNIFALSSALQEYEMQIVIANNGHEAIEKLNSTPEIDLVLMDIMMPKMDGYEAMKKIREEKTYKDLPIIALTAKAMKNDREKCIEAGANDYISKPVDLDKLLSMLRVWLS